jgi:hypothetical protein
MSTVLTSQNALDPELTPSPEFKSQICQYGWIPGSSLRWDSIFQRFQLFHELNSQLMISWSSTVLTRSVFTSWSSAVSHLRSGLRYLGSTRSASSAFRLRNLQERKIFLSTSGKNKTGSSISALSNQRWFKILLESCICPPRTTRHL